LTVTASLSDPAGNLSPPIAVTTGVDITAPGIPGVSLGGGDGFINATEAAGGVVTVGISLIGTGALAGDTLNVNGVLVTLTPDQIAAGTANVPVPLPVPPTGTFTVTASLTDQAGNPSPLATASAVLDTSPILAPVLTVGNGDGIINASEVTNGRVGVTVTLTGTGAVAGDTLTVNGTAITLTADQIAVGAAQTTVAAPATGQILTVIATLADAAGNVSPPAQFTAPVDITLPPVPIVSLENDTGTVGDGITLDGTVLVRGIEPGATWEYSINGGQTWTAGSGPGFELGVGNFNVLVRQTDLAGNSATTSLGPVRILNLDAVNDAATVALTATSTTSPLPQQSGSVTSVLDLGLLDDTVALSLLTAQSPLRFNVAENTTQQVTIQGSGIALAGLTLGAAQDYDLFVYRVDAGQTQGELVFEQENWLDYNPGVLGLLLPTWSGAPLQLPPLTGGGTYYVVLGNSGSILNLSALASITVSTTSNQLIDSRNVTGSISDNVLVGDTLEPGTVVSAVDGTTVAATGTATIDGDYGTLTIGQNGAYTYVADARFTGTDGVQDVFTYTIRSPDGSTDTATLTITLDYPGAAPSLVATTASEPSNDDVIALSFADEDGLASPDADGGDGTPAQPDGLGEISIEDQFDGLLIDGGAQEIDLSGLDLPADDTAQAPLDGEPTTVTPPPLDLADGSDAVPLDPFEPINLEDEQANLPVV
jgi:VCBS repeat-containing protein